MIYNTKKPHLSCSMLTPKEMQQQSTLRAKKWDKKNLSATQRGSLNNGQPFLGRLFF